MKNTIIVCQYGWIIVGMIEQKTKEEVVLKEGYIVRKWTNGKGIGGLADEKNKDEYTLDYLGSVIINRDKILFNIPCNW